MSFPKPKELKSHWSDNRIKQQSKEKHKSLTKERDEFFRKLRNGRRVRKKFRTERRKNIENKEMQPWIEMEEKSDK